MVTTLSYRQTLTVQGHKVASAVLVQTQLDSVLPYVLPVAVTAAVYFILKKFSISPVWVIAGLAVVGIAVGWTGWFVSVVPVK